LLYKFQLNAKKTALERGELAQIVTKKIDSVEQYSKQSLAEVHAFLHTIHNDFDTFLTKHKKEHTSLNMRNLKVTEDLAQAMQMVKPL
jgi:arsenate reductase-like glutaredoxin family protein